VVASARASSRSRAERELFAAEAALLALELETEDWLRSRALPVRRAPDPEAEADEADRVWARFMVDNPRLYSAYAGINLKGLSLRTVQAIVRRIRLENPLPSRGQPL
jgi:hypothetical protein